MSMLEILKHALENLKAILGRQELSLAHDLGTEKAAAWRAKISATKAKIEWLEKLINLCEVN